MWGCSVLVTVTGMAGTAGAAKPKESCVAAPASVADRRSFVVVRVGFIPACGWVALSVTCGQDTELEGAASCDCRVEADICTGDGELAPACNCWRQCSAESEMVV